MTTLHCPKHTDTTGMQHLSYQTLAMAGKEIWANRTGRNRKVWARRKLI